MTVNREPKITVCIPHWQVLDYARICLRSIRKHSRKYDLEVIVVDNGSKDSSLDYLRSLDWIRLIERPNESRANWPHNCFSALDVGAQQGTGEFLVTMHTDVFVNSDCWLDPFLEEMANSDSIGAAGAWKLDLAHPLYLWQKRILGATAYRFKRLLGRPARAVQKDSVKFPRDYCAMYRRVPLIRNEMTFTRQIDGIGGGYGIARQIWDAGFSMGMFPVSEMAQHIVHVAHGTAAVTH